MRIPEEQVEFHPLSQMDKNGRLFQWDDGLYRAIRVAATPLYRQLFDQHVVDRLMARHLLVETELTDLSFNGYGMVVRHRKLPFASYPYEWPVGMFQAAALKVLDLQIELQKHGLSLHDAHPWNVLFEGTEPCYIDFTSIATASQRHDWSMYATFLDMFLHPLLLMHDGYGHLARRLLFDVERGISATDVATMHGNGRRIRTWHHIDAAIQRLISRRIHDGIARRLSHVKQKASHLLKHEGSLERLRHRIAEMEINEPFDHRADFLDHPTAVDFRRQWHEQAIDTLLTRHNPVTILDVGPDPRERLKAEARDGARVLGWSTQGCWSQQMYQAARQAGPDMSKRITPLLMSLRAPTPGYGIRQHMAIPAERRMQCQAVVMLDMLHRMTLRYQLPFEVVAGALSILGTHYALVEFVPLANPSESPEWYTLEHLRAAMRSFYPEVTLVSGPENPRPILLCSRKTGENEVNGNAA